MIETYRSSNVLVIDNFLPTKLARKVTKFTRDEAIYYGMHHSDFNRVLRFSDGEPYESPSVHLIVSPAGKVRLEKPSKRLEGPEAYSYPSDSEVDDVLKAVIKEKKRIAGVVGAAGVKWRHIFSRAYRYPPGTSLGWHSDQSPYTGAFIYFANSEWREEWGGEFLAVDEEKKSKRSKNKGMGLFFQPLPNRIVFLRGGTPHRVHKVIEAPLGRMSVSGFFVDLPYDP